MSQPIQLIINEVLLPTTTHDRYQCYPEELREQIPMISGRIVEEVRGVVQKISYSYDYMGDAKCREVLGALRSRGPKTVAYLPDDGDELVTSTFIVESITNPMLAFFRDGTPKWHNLAFTLREVKPHARHY